MTRERRPDGFYPTDPFASESLRAWLVRTFPQALKQTWIDPAAGYGGLLDGLRIPIAHRSAIELHNRHLPELRRRAPDAKIGNGLTLRWGAKHVAMNPDFDNETMTAFVARALEHQAFTGGLVCCLALATWWHSDALRTSGKKARGLRRPSHILVPAQRVSCDGTGRGDMRAINWLIWHAMHEGPSIVEWLPPAEPDAALLADHKRLAGGIQ